jgi:hypothetical protein
LWGIGPGGRGDHEEMLQKNYENNALKYAKKWARTQGRFQII